MPTTAMHSASPPHLTSVAPDIRSFALDDDQAACARNVGSVRRFLALLQDEDIEAWLTLWADEARQDMPYAPAGFPSAFETKAQIAEQFRALPATYEYMRYPDPEVFSTQDPKVVICKFRGEIKLANSEKRYDNNYVNFFIFDDVGRLTRVIEHFNPLVLTEGGAFGEGGRPTGASS